jgi:hypothetical protein
MNPGLEVLMYEREQKALRQAELEKLQKLTPLEFLCTVWQDPDLPMHVRLRAAAEHARYCAPQLKAVAHVTGKDSASAMIDRARERAAPYAKIVKLEVVPAAQKALPPSQHSPDELKPNATSAANGGQSPSGFRRRI